MPNRLSLETSPYLREHAENPVDWYPWGDEALARARAEDKPIFLSIGYSACHWCHVMARESFSDPKIAQLLNDSFVCIKVDREERPDLDEIYIEAVRLMASTAGWPLSVFLTPDLKPFYGGTYFPPEPRPGLASFERVVTSVLHYYRTERPEIEEAGGRVTAELNRLSSLPGEQPKLDDEPLRRFYEQRLEAFDSEHGGFGIAPKFPNPTDLELLLQLSARPGFEQALDMAELTLRKMADGGMCDQLAGGFHRYSTDTIWLVPHFEKMLYDNALLAMTYCHAFRRTGNDEYRQVAETTLAYIERELGVEGGGFAAAQDADTDGREGSYYVWTDEEVRQAVGDKLAPLALDFYGVTETGNFEHANVLHASMPVEALLRRHRLNLDELWSRLADIRARLLAARRGRPPVHRDDKLLADWNGLALSAFAQAARSFGSRRYVDVARSTAACLERELVHLPDLNHVRRPGLADVPGQLPDYALVSQGLLDLFDAGHEPKHLEMAVTLTDRMVELFSDPNGGFFTTRADSGLIARVKNGVDGAMPSGNSVAVSNLIRLARLTGRNEWERIAARAIETFHGAFSSYPSAFGRMLDGLDLLLHPGPEAVLFLPGESPEGTAMLRELDLRMDTCRTSAVVEAAEPDPLARRLIPMTKGRSAIGGRPTAYVCRDLSCLAPVHSAQELCPLLDRDTDGSGSLDFAARNK